MNDEEFGRIVDEAMDSLPTKYTSKMNNVAVVIADLPTDQQRRQLRLRGGQSLYGLYEGVPLPARAAGYSFVLPDKITIFKVPLLRASRDLDDLKAQVKHTLWHEIAHHFGIGHRRIRELEDRANGK